MQNELVVPSVARRQLMPVVWCFFAVSVASLRLYGASHHRAGPWIVAIFAILTGISIYRLCANKVFVFSPKAIRCETRFLGLLVKSKPIDATPFKWVQSRMDSFNPKNACIELGIEHNYDTVAVQTIKDALGETADVIATRSQIACILGIVDRGHERLPGQRVSS